MEERETSSASSSSGGHTYLPGTASLVQEIDSELGSQSNCRAGATLSRQIVLDSLTLYSYSRAAAGRPERRANAHRIPPQCGPVWLALRAAFSAATSTPLFSYDLCSQSSHAAHGGADPRGQTVWRHSSWYLPHTWGERCTVRGNSGLPLL